MNPLSTKSWFAGLFVLLNAVAVVAVALPGVANACGDVAGNCGGIPYSPKPDRANATVDSGAAVIFADDDRSVLITGISRENDRLSLMLENGEVVGVNIDASSWYESDSEQARLVMNIIISGTSAVVSDCEVYDAGLSACGELKLDL